MARGIYLDNNVYDVLVEGNTVINVSHAGIFLNDGSHDNMIRNNHVYNTEVGICINIYTTSGTTYDHIIEKNTICATGSTQKVVQLIDWTDPVTEAPFIFKDNVYLSLGQVGVFQHNKDKPYSFDQWQAKKNHDINGLFINRESAPIHYSETKIIFNDTNVSKNYQLLDGEYYSLDNKRIEGDLIIKPFCSEILLVK